MFFRLWSPQSWRAVTGRRPWRGWGSLHWELHRSVTRAQTFSQHPNCVLKGDQRALVLWFFCQTSCIMLSCSWTHRNTVEEHRSNRCSWCEALSIPVLLLRSAPVLPTQPHWPANSLMVANSQWHQHHFVLITEMSVVPGRWWSQEMKTDTIWDDSAGQICLKHIFYKYGKKESWWFSRVKLYNRLDWKCHFILSVYIITSFFLQTASQHLLPAAACGDSGLTEELLVAFHVSQSQKAIFERAKSSSESKTLQCCGQEHHQDFVDLASCDFTLFMLIMLMSGGAAVKLAAVLEASAHGEISHI